MKTNWALPFAGLGLILFASVDAEAQTIARNGPRPAGPGRQWSADELARAAANRAAGRGGAEAAPVDTAPVVAERTASASPREAAGRRGFQAGANGAFEADAFVLGVVADANGIRFVPRVDGLARPDLSFQYTLESVAAGSKVLFERSGPVAPKVGAGSRLAYVHASIEERYEIVRTGVEQSFAIASDAGLRGGADLVIAGQVETGLTADLASRKDELSAIAFTDIWTPVLSYGRAIAIDAKGQRIGAPTRLESDGRLTITVPGAWLATAAFPILVDPLLGHEIEVAASVRPEINVDIAHNRTDDRFLVVWEDEISLTNGDIKAQLYNGDGTPNGGTITIDADVADSRRPAVAWCSTSNRFLVAFDDDDGATFSILGAMVSNTGAVVVPTFIITAAADDIAAAPDVGGQLGGGVFCVVYEILFAAFTDTDVYLTLIDSAVNPITVAPQVFVREQLANEFEPSINQASTGVTAWLVGWTDDADLAVPPATPRTDTNIVARSLTAGAGLTMTRGGAFVVSSIAATATGPFFDDRRASLAGANVAGGAPFMLASDFEVAVGDRGVFLRRCTATTTSGTVFDFFDTADDDFGPAFTLYDNNNAAAPEYLLAFTFADALGAEVIVYRGTYTASTITDVEAPIVLTGIGIDALPAVAGRATAATPQHWIAFERAFGADIDIELQRYGAPEFFADFTATPNPATGPIPLTVTFSSAAQVGTSTAFAWNFGDGSAIDTTANPVHTYTVAGTYDVTLTITYAGGKDTATEPAFVTAQPATATPPVAAFTAMPNPATGKADLQVTFNNTSTNATGFVWNFGDGSPTVTTTSPSHTYTTAGAFTVTLTASGPGGPDDVEAKAAFVNVGLDAEFTAAPTAVNTTTPVQFTGTSKGNPTGFSWNFGDGSAADLTQSPAHTYTTPGTYTVTLTVSRAGVANDVEMKTNLITVSANPPVAGFTALPNPATGKADLTVVFTNTSTNATGFVWDFGDGSATVTTTSPTHTYTTAGAFTVKLTATAAGGAMDDEIKAAFVNVGLDAEFTAAPTTVNTTTAVQFTNTSKGNPTGFIWNFGDGTPTVTTTSPAHTYAAAGMYTVTLTATRAGVANDVETKTNLITVTAAAAPVADFTTNPSPATGTAPLNVVFTNTSTGNFTSSFWTFGDGSSSALMSPSHMYASGGSFTATLTVTGPGGPNSKTATITVTPAAPAPIAGFSGTPLNGAAPLSVVFTDASTGSITSRTWTFGDGTSSTATSPTKIYTTAGTFTVTLNVNGPNGADLETKTSYVTVTGAAPTTPVAEFTATPLTGSAPLVVQFTNLSSNASVFSWNFGDLTPLSGTASPSHTYTVAGTYTVALTSSVAGGGTDTETKTGFIVVSAPNMNPPTVDFSATPRQGGAGLVVQFTSEAMPGGSPITSHAWAFGDGGTSSDVNPMHTYASNGTFNVTLTVLDSNGQTATLTKNGFIRVGAVFGKSGGGGGGCALNQKQDTGGAGGAWLAVFAIVLVVGLRKLAVAGPRVGLRLRLRPSPAFAAAAVAIALVTAACGGGGGGGSANLNAQAPQIVSTGPTTASVGNLYTYVVSASGDPTPTVTVTGSPSLPAWLTFNAGVNTLSGTPGINDVGTTPQITVTASNGVGNAATQSFMITVTTTPVAPAITSTSPPTTAVEGQLYTYVITTTGTPTPTLTVIGNPPWLTLTGSTLQGTPPAGSANTNPQLTVRAANGTLPDATQLFTITITAQGTTLVAPQITSTAQTTALVGSLYAYSVTTTGTPTPNVSTNTLPAWLMFNATTRVLSGTPTAANVGVSTSITITAANGTAPNATQTFTIDVQAPPAITSMPVVTATVGQNYTYTITSTGRPAPTLMFTQSPAAPAFLSLNGAVLGSMPVPAGANASSPYRVTITATNSRGTATQEFDLAVAPAAAGTPPNITSTPASTTLTEGVAFAYQVVATGTAPITYTKTSAGPAWLAIGGANNDTLQGTPPVGSSAQSPYAVQITAANGFPPNDVQDLMLTVQAGGGTPAVFVTFSFAGAAGNEATLAADGATAPAGLASIPVMSRGSGISPSAAADKFSSNGWVLATSPQGSPTPTGPVDANDYYEFTLTPAANFSMTLTAIELDERRSNTGARGWSIRTGNFTTDLGAFVLPANDLERVNQSVNLGAGFSNLTTPVTFRIFGYHAETAQGTWRIDNVQVTGFTSAGGSPPAQPLLAQDFEGTGIPTGWSTDADPTPPASDWEFGVPVTEPAAAFLGTKVAGTLLNGTYTSDPNGRRSFLQTPVLNFTGVNNPSLRFAHYYNIEIGSVSAFDGGNLKISTDGGTSFVLVDPSSISQAYDRIVSSSFGNPLAGEPAWSGVIAGMDYNEVNVDLASSLAGQPLTQVVLQFDFGSDDSTEAPGWYIDEVYAGDRTGFPVSPVAKITSKPATTATANQQYTYPITVTGTPAPVITVTGMPNGMTRVADTLTWTPTTPGQLGFTGRIVVTADNGLLPVAVQQFTINVFPVGGPVNPDLLLSEAFDAAAALPVGWTTGVKKGTTSDWQVGVRATGPTPVPSGANILATNLAASYTASTESFVDTPSLDFTGVVAPVFRFEHFFDESADPGFDGGNLKVSLDGGRTFALVDGGAIVMNSYNTNMLGGTSLTGQDGWSGPIPPAMPSTVYESVEVDLTQVFAAGQDLTNVVFRFDFVADTSLQDDGWSIDSVRAGEDTIP